ncbi:MAG: dihydrolipoyl dehydrogenase [Nitrososphaerales archaeon]|nr:dihydrolipoyl dehydrogenase [Nitrososphaerales archaeon]
MGIDSKVFDIIVIGGGPAGYSAAVRAGRLGGSVALVERRALGGVCLNEGCIPTKFLLNVVDILSLKQRAARMGIEISGVKLDLQEVMKSKELIIKRLRRGIELMMEANRVRVFKGTGTLIDREEVMVSQDNGERCVLKAKNVIVATGSRPFKPPIPGIDGKNVITNEEALALQRVPSKVVIIGGGSMGVEFATILRSFGAQVSIVEMLPRILPLEDSEISMELHRNLTRLGVSIYTNAKVVEIKDEGEEKVVRYTSNNTVGEVKGDLVLLASGRRPNVEGLGLEKLGVIFSKDGIVVNEHMETNVRGIYAAGDVVGKYLLAYTAFEEGIVAAENAMGNDVSIDYTAIPRCTFSRPEVGAVGLTEDEARRKGYDIAIGKFPFRACGRAVVEGEMEGFVKIITDRKDGRILGVHIIGHGATELIHEAVLALKMNATVAQLSSTYHAHPTFSEAIKEAALDTYGRAIHKV